MTDILEFETRTGKIILDYSKCNGCNSFECVKACSLYGRGVLRIRGGKPVLGVSLEDAKRLCNECLACEIHCLLKANGAIKIILPIPGLEEYKRRWS